jgi:hypothetical protein
MITLYKNLFYSEDHQQVDSYGCPFYLIYTEILNDNKDDVQFFLDKDWNIEYKPKTFWQWLKIKG